MTAQTTYPAILKPKSRPLLSESVYDLICDIGPDRWILAARTGWESGFKVYGRVEETHRPLQGLQKRAGAFAEKEGLILCYGGWNGTPIFQLSQDGERRVAEEEARRNTEVERQNRWNDHLRVCDVCRSRLPTEEQQWYVLPLANELAVAEAQKTAQPCRDGEFYEEIA